MSTEILTWVVMVELPVFAALFKMISKSRQEADNHFMTLKEDCGQEVIRLRESLAEFKLHVARNYVSVNYLKDVENRLTDHLLRIEKKLDKVGEKS